MQGSPEQIRRNIDEVRVWYHTMELAPGIVTPGYFDLRPIVDQLPWPDVTGKRCLDLGPWDGFFAFELERRGAGSVVAADIADHRSWDWPPATRQRGVAYLQRLVGDQVGLGFEVARSALESKVERIELSAYELDPTTCGEFDVVVCGALLLHLRDPLRALERIRSVCRSSFMSAEQINVTLTAMHPQSPAARLRGTDFCQWWVPNASAHRRMIEVSGFAIADSTRPYAVPFGPAHPGTRQRPQARLRARLGRTALRIGPGVAHSAALAHPV